MPPNHFKYNITVGPFHQFEKFRDARGLYRKRDNCSVDIIIPYHGRYDLVRRALLSVLQHTHSNPYLVTLVDDGSPGDASVEFIKTISQAPQTQCLRLEKQGGFGAAVTMALQNTTQNYVCVLHSDCKIRHMNWLSAMGEALVSSKNKSVRLVSAKSNTVDEDIPELGMTEHEFQSQEPNTPDITIVDSPLPMYCFMCHRGLFERIGSLQPYPFTWYENVEYFYRMKHHGYKQAVANRAWVSHDGGGTVKNLWRTQPDVEKVMRENKDRCVADIRELKQL